MKLEKQLQTIIQVMTTLLNIIPNRPGEPLKSHKEEMNRSVLDYRKIIG